MQYPKWMALKQRNVMFYTLSLRSALFFKRVHIWQGFY